LMQAGTGCYKFLSNGANGVPPIDMLAAG
jgi:hypothetical protein